VRVRSEREKRSVLLVALRCPVVVRLGMATVTSPHVWLDERGVAWVDDTNTKVREIALDVIAHGWSPQEIRDNHRHLSLAQIHGALTFYYDHKEKIDVEISAARNFGDEMRSSAENSPAMQKLMAHAKTKKA
jgi:uncharacterized protein (DUF433 family)